MVMKTIDYTSVDGSLLRGVVRLTNHELADHDRSRYSRGELTPFSERNSAVLLEDVAAVEVAGHCQGKLA
jgi:hypothetical protein